MKFTTIIAAVLVVSTADAHRLRSRIQWKEANDDDHLDIPDEDDPFIVVPPQKIAVEDAKWGHEVERRGQGDWLDEHVKVHKAILDWIPPMPDKEDRKAIYDS